ncbi:hypothetical protein ITJ66_06090 [Plantibacter sp. VKM Ac-2885]|uniref:hypothetical protein n=1 Tax=Plantibacter TaxID=190323 RepID=UPI0010C22BFA|nr:MULTISPECIES: hypothetical protein [Plantibacter]MBD8516993.1 hypothetical protein [Plantibacter sp. CFBP 8804]MBF4512053.1 hypothetical protein [Plantibacter sp. VKM Ac-2885]TKJ99018.1 hypothetical protein PlfCFBP13513_06275 [Plantibacter flavus]CAH0187686.1 hypothetical protein SRABI02_01646 [Plantibacter cousiniae]
MSSLTNPRGPERPAVYWRRRLIVFGVLLAVIVLVIVLIVRLASGPGTENTAAKTTPTPTATPAPTPAPEASTTAPIDEAATTDPGSAAACTADQIRVEAVVNGTSFAADELPQLSLSVTNTGSAACTMNAGTSQQVFTVSSGEEPYWTSTDCQTAPSDQQVLLEPGKTVSSNPPITWDRTRSAPDTCDQPRDPVPAGGASYHLNTSIGGFASADSAQFLLN